MRILDTNGTTAGSTEDEIEIISDDLRALIVRSAVAAIENKLDGSVNPEQFIINLSQELMITFEKNFTFEREVNSNKINKQINDMLKEAAQIAMNNHISSRKIS